MLGTCHFLLSLVLLHSNYISCKLAWGKIFILLKSMEVLILATIASWDLRKTQQVTRCKFLLHYSERNDALAHMKALYFLEPPATFLCLLYPSNLLFPPTACSFSGTFWSVLSAYYHICNGNCTSMIFRTDFILTQYKNNIWLNRVSMWNVSVPHSVAASASTWSYPSSNL